MGKRLRRSIDDSIREDLTWDDTWLGPDKGLIYCWERGRQKRNSDPELAARAEQGELVTLPWVGGVEKKLKIEKKHGSLKYLAMWQGLRGQDLDLPLEGEQQIVCSKTRQAVSFSSNRPIDEE